MKKVLKKSLPGMLSVAVFSLSASTVIAASGGVLQPIQPIHPTQHSVIPISAELIKEDLALPRFASVTGIVTEITDYGAEKAMKLVSIETAEEEIVRFVISDDTYIIDEFVKGSEVIAFYDTGLPVIMIYPPQYGAEIIALAEGDRTLKVDRFDEDMISSDGSLQLNVSEDTEILLEDGTVYNGDLTDRELVVSYGASTRSIPAQTSPEQIIVIAEKELPPVTDMEEQPLSYSYESVVGTIQEIQPHGTDQDMQLITVEVEADQVVNIVVSDQTYLDLELNIGSEVIAFYDAQAPAIMIYPPQYSAVVIAEADKERTLKVDRFNRNLLSSDETLILMIQENTEITSQDGTPFEGKLEGRKLLVEYEVTMLSLPAKTSPKRIVVLNEAIAPLPQELEDGQSEEELLELPIIDTVDDIASIEDKLLLVDNEIINAPSAFTNDQGTIMVPLRAIGEAIGYEIKWDGKTKTVQLDNTISLQIGVDHYINVQAAATQLGTAPILVNGSTFVPLSFFTEVTQLNNAYVFEDAIYIDNEDKIN